MNDNGARWAEALRRSAEMRRETVKMRGIPMDPSVVYGVAWFSWYRETTHGCPEGWR